MQVVQNSQAANYIITYNERQGPASHFLKIPIQDDSRC